MVKGFSRSALSMLVASIPWASSAISAPPDGSTCPRRNNGFMSTTFDGGTTIEAVRTPMMGPNSIPPLTWGLIALDDIGTLVMHADEKLWGSLNDGCTWSRLGNTVGGLFRIVSDGAGVAYAWQINGGQIYQISNTTATRRGWSVVDIDGKVNDMDGLDVDRTDPLHIRAAGNIGQIWESFDGGISWTPSGVPAATVNQGGLVMTFDPSDFDHAVYGRTLDGGFVTFDAGATWTQSAGLTVVAGGDTNLFSAVISPLNGDIVFAMAVDREEWLSGDPSNGRHIYESLDGGLTYTPVMSENTDDVILTSGPLLVANPFDANRLHLFASLSPGFGGTRFYDYDLSTGIVQTIHNPDMTRIRSMEISRVTPEAIHVGFDYQ